MIYGRQFRVFSLRILFAKGYRTEPVFISWLFNCLKSTTIYLHMRLQFTTMGPFTKDFFKHPSPSPYVWPVRCHSPTPLNIRKFKSYDKYYILQILLIYSTLLRFFLIFLFKTVLKCVESRRPFLETSPPPIVQICLVFSISHPPPAANVHLRTVPLWEFNLNFLFWNAILKNEFAYYAQQNQTTDTFVWIRRTFVEVPVKYFDKIFGLSPGIFAVIEMHRTLVAFSFIFGHVQCHDCTLREIRRCDVLFYVAKSTDRLAHQHPI